MQPLRILFVTPYVPSLLRTRPHGFIRGLIARGHRIALVTAASSEAEEDQADDLRRLCDSVTVVRVPLVRSLWNCALGIAGSLPFQANFTYSPALAEAVRPLLRGGAVDVVHVEHLRAARIGLGIRDVPRVFDAVDCISALFERAAEHAPSAWSRWRTRLDLGRTRRFEGRLVRQFDAALVTSESDRAALLELAGDGPPVPLRVVANGVDLAYFSPVEAPRNDDEVVFVGRMSYHANVAAAAQLVEQVMPHVWNARPETKVNIVGADPSPHVRALARDRRVTVTGAVADIRPWLTRAAVSACPLVYAAGIQNKVLEAMACATPVVASSAACDALAARREVHLLQADGAPAFGRALLRLLGDESLRRTIGRGGRAYVEAHHDWQSAAAQLEQIYNSTLNRS